jgi:hypothetical protein
MSKNGLLLPGTGNFRTLQEAINAMRGLSQQWVTIHIRKGTYREKIVIPSWKTMIIQWDDFSAEDLTIGNTGVWRGRPLRCMGGIGESCGPGAGLTRARAGRIS